MGTLYYYPNNASMAPHIVLEEIGAPFELHRVDRDNNTHKDPAYLRLNPNGVIPTYVDGDLVLFEAAAICLHLADTNPAAGLAPPLGTAERAQFYKWLVHLTNTVQAEMLFYFYPERLADDAKASATVKARAEARVDAMFERVEAALAAGGPYLLGARFSAADLYFLMLARWTRGMTNPARNRPATRRLLDRLIERPAVKRAFATEGVAAPLF